MTSADQKDAGKQKRSAGDRVFEKIRSTRNQLLAHSRLERMFTFLLVLALIRLLFVGLELVVSLPLSVFVDVFFIMVAIGIIAYVYAATSVPVSKAAHYLDQTHEFPEYFLSYVHLSEADEIQQPAREMLQKRIDDELSNEGIRSGGQERFGGLPLRKMVAFAGILLVGVVIQMVFPGQSTTGVAVEGPHLGTDSGPAGRSDSTASEQQKQPDSDSRSAAQALIDRVRELQNRNEEKASEKPSASVKKEWSELQKKAEEILKNTQRTTNPRTGSKDEFTDRTEEGGGEGEGEGAGLARRSEKEDNETENREEQPTGTATTNQEGNNAHREDRRKSRNNSVPGDRQRAILKKIIEAERPGELAKVDRTGGNPGSAAKAGDETNRSPSPGKPSKKEMEGGVSVPDNLPEKLNTVTSSGSVRHWPPTYDRSVNAYLRDLRSSFESHSEQEKK